MRDGSGPGKKRPRAAGRRRFWRKAASGCGTTPALAKSGLGLRCKRWMTFRKFGKPQVKRVWPFVSYGIHRSPRRKNATRLPHGRIPGFGTWQRMMRDKTAGFGISCRKIADKIRGLGYPGAPRLPAWYPPSGKTASLVPRIARSEFPDLGFLRASDTKLSNLAEIGVPNRRSCQL